MTAHTSLTGESAAGVSQPKVNTLSIVSIVLVVVAVTSLAVTDTVLRSWAPMFSGITVLAVPAVGAGHVALLQIKMRRERGAFLAFIALGICYLFAAYELFSGVFAGIVLAV